MDIALPAEGVFHNLVFVSIDKKYPGHADKVMHALWGQGLMSLAKVLVVVPFKGIIRLLEPEVQKAPVNAAWMLRPRSGEAPRASEALLRRAREGAGQVVEKPAEVVRAATVAWAPPTTILMFMSISFIRAAVFAAFSNWVVKELVIPTMSGFSALIFSRIVFHGAP